MTQDFERWSKDILRAEIKSGDLQSDNFVDKLNGIIKNRTKNLIPKLIPKRMKEDTKIAIINSLYFSGRWRKAFAFELFENSTNINGTKTEIEMMNVDFRYGRGYMEIKWKNNNTIKVRIDEIIGLEKRR